MNMQDKKIKIILNFFFICIFLIICRLFYLQVYNSERFSLLGERNILRFDTLNSPRGNIIDFNGAILATNKPIFDVYWVGRGNKVLSENQRDILDKLISILSISDKEKLIPRIEKYEKHSKYLKVAEDVNFDLLCKVSEQCFNSTNLLIIQHFRRFYPYKNLASHALGYLGYSSDENYEGKCGIEKIFHNKLKGERGYVLNVTNAAGEKLLQKEYKEAKGGEEIKITLDFELQRIAEDLFNDTQSGSFILFNAVSGDIKVLLSYPNFDPNKFLSSISKEEWEDKFSQNFPLLNRVTNALYPPASIFKLVTYAAGLEEGIISFDTQFKCKGHIKFGGRKYYCIRRWGHGNIFPKESIAYSCNIPCFEIAKNLKVDELASYAHKFGLGRKTNFILPEKNGLVPTNMWKLTTKKEPWWPGETLSACIGQSYLLVTPLQIARMIGAIATGYLVKPRLLFDDPIESEELELKKSTLDFLRESMKCAVEFGTASGLRHFEDLGFSIFAKTGTAQTISLEKVQLDKNMLEHGWFASFFNYKGQDPLVMVVLVEHTGRSAPALDIASKFLSAYSMLMEQYDNQD